MCVALALLFVVGVMYAADGEKGKREGDKKPASPTARGTVKAVAEDGATITVTVKKEGAEPTDLTFNVVKEGEGATKVFVGREQKTLANVTVGANVMVAYKVTDAGNQAIVVRVVTAEGAKEGKKREGGKRD